MTQTRYNEIQRTLAAEGAPYWWNLTAEERKAYNAITTSPEQFERSRQAALCYLKSRLVALGAL